MHNCFLSSRLFYPSYFAHTFAQHPIYGIFCQFLLYVYVAFSHSHAPSSRHISHNHLSGDIFVYIFHYIVSILVVDFQCMFLHYRHNFAQLSTVWTKIPSPVCVHPPGRVFFICFYLLLSAFYIISVCLVCSSCFVLSICSAFFVYFVDSLSLSS